MSSVRNGGGTIAVGDLLRDNDPRMVNRILMVMAVMPDCVQCVDTSGRRRVYSTRRIFCDDKLRKTGLSKISGTPVVGPLE